MLILTQLLFPRPFYQILIIFIIINVKFDFLVMDSPRGIVTLLVCYNNYYIVSYNISYIIYIYIYIYYSTKLYGHASIIHIIIRLIYSFLDVFILGSEN